MPLLIEFVKKLKKVETKTLIRIYSHKVRLIRSTLYDNEAFSAVNNTYGVIDMIPTQKHLQIP